jgi:predicted DNA-binding protein with PD1-like motif
MKYQIGSPGRIILVRFEDREDVLDQLVTIAKKENIRAAVFSLLGGMRGGRFVVGPEKDEMPPKPLWRELGESHEILGTGTIFWQGDAPKVHFHGVFGKRDTVRVGCLREKSETFLILEAVITEIQGIKAVREHDPVSGMTLLKL